MANKDKERRALLAAAEKVIADKGFAATTAADVAARAGLPLATFDAHFDGTSKVLRALSEEFAERMIAVTDQSTRSGIWQGSAARDVVEVAVRSIFDVVLERRELVRAFLAQGAVDPEYAADLRRIGTHMSQRIIAVFAECVNVPARPSRAVAFSLLTAVALAHHTILVGAEWSGVTFSKDQLAEEASRAICAYLGMMPTIAIKDDGPDAAPTGMIHALKTEEYEAIPQELLPESQRRG